LPHDGDRCDIAVEAEKFLREGARDLFGAPECPAGPMGQADGERVRPVHLLDLGLQRLTGGPGERGQDRDRANLEAGRLEGGADFPDDRPESQHQCRLLGTGAGQQAEPRPTRTVPDDQAREGHHHGPKKIARGGVNPAGVARSAAHAAVSFPFKGVNGRRTACGDEANEESVPAPRIHLLWREHKRADHGGSAVGPGIGC